MYYKKKWLLLVATFLLEKRLRNLQPFFAERWVENMRFGFSIDFNCMSGRLKSKYRENTDSVPKGKRGQPAGK